MDTMRFLVILISFATAPALWLAAATEYFVAIGGDDTHSGTAAERAFATVQRGVDALAPGDVLTILPGEYFEAVRREDIGSMDVETLIRAAIPATVVLRGDEAAPEFSAVDGFQWVYSATIDGPVKGVSEVDTLTPLRRVASPAEVEFEPGSYYHDVETGRLFISSSDTRDPAVHAYRISRLADHGLFLINPKRVRISGLIATGYTTDHVVRTFPGYGWTWGILLADPDHCTIEGSVAYLNGGGISIHRSGDGTNNLIDRCRVYATAGGGIRGFSADNDEIRNSEAFRCGGTGGIQFYGAGNRGRALMNRNLAWGNSTSDIRIKGGQREMNFAENCITLGNLDVANVTSSVIGGDNIYNRDTDSDVIWFDREVELEAGREFVDPANLDFRLQSTSRFRGTGIDGQDRGAFPFKGDVFFVSTDGADDADGMSLGTAWQTLDTALSRLRPGDTLYLLAGDYVLTEPHSIGGESDDRVSIRGRGTEVVTISGNIELVDCHNLAFERIGFGDLVSVSGGSGLSFANCWFLGEQFGLKADAVAGLRVTDSVFTGFGEAAIRSRGSERIFLQSTLFDNDGCPAIDVDSVAALQYSDHNAFSDRDGAWLIGGSLRQSQSSGAGHGRYSVEVTPGFDLSSGSREVVANPQLYGVSPDGGAIGPHRFYATSRIIATEPAVHSVSDTTVDIEWWTSAPARCVVEWGPADGEWSREAIVTSSGYASLSLVDLKPGAGYRMRLVSVEPDEGAVSRNVRGIQPNVDLSFATLAGPTAPRTFYVSAAGSDSNSGLSADEALRTVSHAASLARAGDTVMIGGGTYTESVRIRSTGAVGRPVTFKAAAGEQVIVDGGRRMITTAFHIRGKNHIHLDGFYFQWIGSSGWNGAINVVESNHVTISRCLYNGRGAGYAPRFINAVHSDFLTIENCVFANGFDGMVVRGCANLVVRNSVFLRNLIQGMIVNNNPDQPVTLENNVFVDSHTGKARSGYLEMARVEGLSEDNNLFYMRLPDEERKVWWFYGNEQYERAMEGYSIPVVYHGEPLMPELTRMSLAEYQSRFAPGSTSRFGDPQFAIVETFDAEAREGYTGDRIAGRAVDFPDLFVTNPELDNLGIGLDPAAFADFHFNVNP